MLARDLHVVERYGWNAIKSRNQLVVCLGIAFKDERDQTLAFIRCRDPKPSQNTPAKVADHPLDLRSVIRTVVEENAHDGNLFLHSTALSKDNSTQFTQARAGLCAAVLPILEIVGGERGVKPNRQKQEAVITALTRFKLEVAEEIGLLPKIREVGWAGLSAEEAGHLGGVMSKRLREKGLGKGDLR